MCPRLNDTGVCYFFEEGTCEYLHPPPSQSSAKRNRSQFEPDNFDDEYSHNVHQSSSTNQVRDVDSFRQSQYRHNESLLIPIPVDSLSTFHLGTRLEQSQREKQLLRPKPIRSAWEYPAWQPSWEPSWEPAWEQTWEHPARPRKRRTSSTSRSRLRSIPRIRAPNTGSALSYLNDLMLNMTNKSIHVLHDVHISEEERLILSLGLNFIPPDHFNSSWCLTSKFLTFQRNVRLSYFFKDVESITSSENTIHRLVSKEKTFEEKQANFTPPQASVEIENYLSQVHNKLSTIVVNNKNRRKHCNIPQAFFDALRDLKARTKDSVNGIIITEADKNLGTTVMDRRQYELEATGPKQLGDINSYLPIIGPPLLDPIKAELLAIFKKDKWLNNGHIAKKLLADLCYHMKDLVIQCCRMFFYPKLHKDVLSFRPLCSSSGYITYLTSKYIDIETQIVLQQIPSAVRNSNDVIIAIENTTLPPGGSLVQADVKDMFPSIDIVEGLHSMRWALTYFKFHIDRINFLCNLTEWVHTNNFVQFCSKFYKQNKGTAMVLH